MAAARNYLSPVGRSIYAIAILGIGLVCLVTQDVVNSLEPVPADVPGYTAIVWLTSVVLIGAGLSILCNIRTRPVALVLAAFFGLWILVLHVPSAFIMPELLRSPWWIRTFESLALGGAGLILAGSGGRIVRESWVAWGRMSFGVSLPVFGVLHFVYPESVAGLVALSPVGYPWPLFWAYLTGAGHFTAGLAIVSGWCARLAAILAGIMYASWFFTLHLPRLVDHPASYSGNRQEVTSALVCLAFWGAAWIVADSPSRRRGQPSP